MEGYKQRLVNEYRQLYARIERLGEIVDEYHSGELEFTLNCPIKLLERQLVAMSEYLFALEERQFIEICEDPKIRDEHERMWL